MVLILQYTIRQASWSLAWCGRACGIPLVWSLWDVHREWYPSRCNFGEYPLAVIPTVSWYKSVGFSVHLVIIFNLVHYQFSSHIAAIWNLVWNWIWYHVALVWHGSGSLGWSSFLPCSCTYIGCSLFAMWAYRLRSQGALVGSPPAVLPTFIIIVLWVQLSIHRLVQLPLLAFSSDNWISGCFAPPLPIQ
jgi:hypothetical protein